MMLIFICPRHLPVQSSSIYPVYYPQIQLVFEASYQLLDQCIFGVETILRSY